MTNTQWHWWEIPFWRTVLRRPVRLLDGSDRSAGDVMRRRFRGVWQYRAVSAADYAGDGLDGAISRHW